MAGGLGLFGIVEQLVLIANAMAIINKEWILKKCSLKRQLACTKPIRGESELYSVTQEATHIWSLYNEELWKIPINNSEHFSGLHKASIWINILNYYYCLLRRTGINLAIIISNLFSLSSTS